MSWIKEETEDKILLALTIIEGLFWNIAFIVLAILGSARHDAVIMSWAIISLLMIIGSAKR